MRCLVLTVVLLASLAKSASAAPGVLVLFSGERALPAHAEYEDALRADLGLPDADIEYSAEFLDANRFNAAQADAFWLDFLTRKYAGHDVRVVIVVDHLALGFVLRNRAALFPAVPVVVTAVSENELQSFTLPPDFRVLSVRYEPGRTMEVALKLQPTPREIVTIIGSSDGDRLWVDLLQDQLPPVVGQVPVRYLKDLTIGQMRTALAGLNSDTIVLRVPITRDAAGRTPIPAELSRQLSDVTPAPTYVMFSTTLGSGAVGGQMTTYTHIGQWAGGIVRPILNGEPLANIPMRSVVPSNFVVDWRALQKWGLDEARLPPDAEVRFKTPTLWQEHKVLITALSTLMVLLAVSLVALLVQRRRREIAEAEVHTVRNELTHLTRVSLIGELSASLAHELNQPLTAILTNAQAAQRYLQAPQPDLDTIREILADIANDDRRAGEVIRRLRALLKKGEPQVQSLRVGELVDSVLRLANNDLTSREVTVITDLPAGLPAVAGDRVQVQQVLLNLVMNAADAMRTLARPDRRIIIRANPVEGKMLEVTVRDRGDGIAADQLTKVFEPFFTTKAEGLGMGLSISRTIAESHGGRLWATNNPDRGASLHLLLPMA